MMSVDDVRRERDAQRQAISEIRDRWATSLALCPVTGRRPWQDGQIWSLMCHSAAR